MSEKKESKRYIKVYAAVAILGLIFVAGLTIVEDPLYQYHMPWNDKGVYAYDERYQNPGIAKNTDYDSIVIGSSMSENFNCEWFDEGFGINTIKLTYSGASVKDWRNAVNLGVENGEVKYVFSNLDYGILSQEYDKEIAELPEYLYNNNYFDDVYYIFNKDILFDRTIFAMQTDYEDNLKDAYSWYEVQKDLFGKDRIFKLIEYGGEYKDVIQKNGVLDDNILNGVEQIKTIILENPQTQFKLFYSPYSILKYYECIMQGNIDILLEVYTYSMKELLECENVELYFPTYNNVETITDLDKYKDLTHYNLEVQYTIYEQMRDGVNKVTEDNYLEIMKWFEDTVKNYDYSALFAKYNKL